MKRIIYRSQARAGIRSGELAELLAISRRNNARTGVTGLLIYSHGFFLQVLEGLDHQVDQTFDRIQRDERHSACQLVQEKTIFEPDFGEWKMGFWTNEVSHEDQRAGIISVQAFLSETESSWLAHKTELNELLWDEIIQLRESVAA